MSDVQGRCHVCHTTGPKGFTRNFLCGKCVDPEHFSQYCTACRRMYRFDVETAGTAFEGFDIDSLHFTEGVIIVLDFCGNCIDHVVIPEKIHYQIYKAGKEKAVRK